VAGPFLYKEGLLAQEEEKGLVCRDFNGKVRWVIPLQIPLPASHSPFFWMVESVPLLLLRQDTGFMWSIGKASRILRTHWHCLRRLPLP
jgi:hypothetical protein